MKNNNKKLAMILFVISTTLILGSNIDAYAHHSDGVRGTTGDGDLEGCLNGAAGDQICNTAAEWNGQNISNEALYFEGNSIPIRVDITDLDTTDGLVQKLIIDWDITKSQGGIKKHTFDYLTSFDTTDNPHPCLLAETRPRCDGFVSDTIPIPPPGANTTTETVGNSTQPLDSFNAQPANNKLFYMFAPGGSELEILHIDYVSEGDPTGQASNTETNVIFVEFTTNSPNVIAAFGAHISNPEDWVNTASDVNGSPYRVGCVEITEQGGCNASINVSSNVIVPIPDSILTLIKEVVNDNGGDVGASAWTLTAIDSNNVTLIDEPGTPDTVEDLTASVDAIASVGTEYTLSESNGPLGYFAQNNDQFICVKTLNEVSGQPFSTNTITLNEGESAVCTITNDDTAPQLTVIKDPTNDDGGNALPDDFLLTVNGEAVLSGATNSYDSNTDLTLGETQLPGYAFVSVTGDEQCPADLNTAFQLSPGDNVTCTITNDDATTMLTIIKDPTNDDGGNALPDDFLLTVNGEAVLSGATNSYDSNTDLTLG
ncbi:MAG: hypothetical protein OEM89_07030, partial [Nitrosopumilus sp.]|nr:hypothetical protein [Nitrosopumilus sp.]